MVWVRSRWPQGTETDDSVHLGQREKKKQARRKFARRPSVHGMVVVVEVKALPASENLGDLLRVQLIRPHGFADAAGTRHVVVGHADQIAGVAFFDQLQGHAGGEDRNVIPMGLDPSLHFPRMRLSRNLFLVYYS